MIKNLGTYKLLILYLLLVFIPLNIYVYNPKLFNFDFLNFSKEKNNNVTEPQTSTFESFVTDTKNVPLEVYYEIMNSESRYKGNFESINGNSLTLKENGVEENTFISTSYSLDSSTLFICYKDKIDSINTPTWDVYMDYKNKGSVDNLLYISSLVPFEQKLDYLRNYPLDRPIVFGLNKDTEKTIAWMELYLEDCSYLDSGVTL